MLGEKILDLRKQKGVTQRQMADELGTSQKAVSKWEKNAATPKDKMKLKIANYFGISLFELYGRDFNIPGGNLSNCMKFILEAVEEKLQRETK